MSSEITDISRTLEIEDFVITLNGRSEYDYKTDEKNDWVTSIEIKWERFNKTWIVDKEDFIYEINTDDFDEVEDWFLDNFDVDSPEDLGIKIKTYVVDVSYYVIADDETEASEKVKDEICDDPYSFFENHVQVRAEGCNLGDIYC